MPGRKFRTRIYHEDHTGVPWARGGGQIKKSKAQWTDMSRNTMIEKKRTADIIEERHREWKAKSSWMATLGMNQPLRNN